MDISQNLHFEQIDLDLNPYRLVMQGLKQWRILYMWKHNDSNAMSTMLNEDKKGGQPFRIEDFCNELPQNPQATRSGIGLT